MDDDNTKADANQSLLLDAELAKQQQKIIMVEKTVTEMRPEGLESLADAANAFNAAPFPPGSAILVPQMHAAMPPNPVPYVMASPFYAAWSMAIPQHQQQTAYPPAAMQAFATAQAHYYQAMQQSSATHRVRFSTVVGNVNLHA
jgi:hypothetical protein